MDFGRGEKNIPKRIRFKARRTRMNNVQVFEEDEYIVEVSTENERGETKVEKILRSKSLDRAILWGRQKAKELRAELVFDINVD